MIDTSRQLTAWEREDNPVLGSAYSPHRVISYGEWCRREVAWQKLRGHEAHIRYAPVPGAPPNCAVFLGPEPVPGKEP